MTRLPLLCLLLATACSADDDSDKAAGAGGDGGASDSGGADGGDGGTIEPVYPTGTRALLYYGHGGYSQVGDAGGFTDFDDHIKATTGWNVDHRSDWTEDLTDYRMVAFLAMGHDGGDLLSEAELETLRAASARGTRLVFMADVESCDSAVMADTIARLGSTMGYTGEAPDPTYIAAVTGDDLNANHQLTAGLGEVRFQAPCWVSGGSPIARASNGNAVVASQLLDTGGEVLVMGDFGVIDDAGNFSREDLDNMAFGVNLVTVDPAL